MYIYNVTINIDESVHDRWLEWMKKEHIPAMLATGKFLRALMTRVNIEEDMGSTSYSIQYTTDSKDTLRRYYEEDASQLQAQSKIFEGKYVSFRTELEVIGEAHNELFNPKAISPEGGIKDPNEKG
jgi:hypothetical protein